jgi:hypothetical protein
MKILSLKQPYSELVLYRKNEIEFRNGNTNFNNQFLIHASKTPDQKAIERFGFSNLLLGGIVGKAELLGVKKYNTEEEHKLYKDLHLASNNFGNHGFILKNPIRLNFIPLNSKLNFFEVEI